MASTTAADNSGSGSGMAVKHGAVGKGPVVGLVQVSQRRRRHLMENAM